MADQPAAGADGKPAGDKPAGGGAPEAKPTDVKPGDKPAADAKPDAKDGDKKPDDKDGKPQGAPEKYADFKLPEGVKLDEPTMGKFSELAKKHGLSQEAAQEFVTLGAQMQAGNAQALQAAIDAQGETWAGEAKADKEYGGDKFDENLAVAKGALDKFGTPQLKALLVQSKLGNHPEVLRTFFRIGKAISEDGFVPGRTGTAGGSIAQRMYPNMNP